MTELIDDDTDNKKMTRMMEDKHCTMLKMTKLIDDDTDIT